MSEIERLRPLILQPDEGVRYEARGSKMVFKALTSTAGGHFSLMERTLPPGGRMPPPHRHIDTDEAYFVLEGEVTFVLEGEERRATERWWLLVPGGVAHTFGNRSTGSARLLVLHAPPLDGYFRALHDLWHREVPPTTEEELELMRLHGMER
jgi:mannose-6-phosphate isomerase-like protein (cupin superfamily)